MQDDLHLATDAPESASKEAGTKVGKVLSDANRKKLMTAMASMQAVMDSAGLTDSEKAAGLREFARKCGCDDYDDWMPVGGATSFAEIDAYCAAQEKTDELNDLSYNYQAIVSNIWANEEMSVVEKANAIAAAAGDLQSRMTQAASKENRSWIATVKAKLFGGKPVGLDIEVDERSVSAPSPIGIFKDASGQWRYLCTSTNSFRDKQGEVFSPAAHEDYVRWVDETKEYPELWLWHTPNTRIGKADCIYYDADLGRRVTTGLFDKGLEDVAERLSQMPELAMSHGYLFRKEHLDDGGIYHRYRDFEETLLPSSTVAANDDTAFIAGREANVSAPTMKREFFEQVLGKDRFAKFEESLGGRAKDMTDDELGAAFKAALAAKDETVAPTPADPTPTTAPEGTVEASTDEKALAAVILSGVKESMPALIASAMKDAVEPVTTRLDELAEWRKSVDATLASLGESDDAKIAAKFAARTPITIVPPSTDPETVVDGRSVKGLREALGGSAKEDAAASPVGFAVEMLTQNLRQPALA